MVLFVLLGVIVLITVVVLSVLFFMLNQESKKPANEKVVPITEIERKQLLGTPKEEAVIVPLRVPEATITPPGGSNLVDGMFKQRAQDLEEELHTISRKAEDQSNEAKKMVEDLTRENEELKAQKAGMDQAQQQLTQTQQEVTDLKTENFSLQTRLDTASSQAKMLEEEMAVVKVQMGEEIHNAKEMIDRLTQEKEGMFAASKPPQPDEVLRKEIEDLKAELIEQKRKYAELEDASRSKQEDIGQAAAPDSLQYELIKARAQSSGLERIAHNYKIQLEDFFKKMNTAQSTNEQLSEAKNRLEGVVEQMQLQNEELEKKDQLAQFELEKNRNRLVNLEREYQELKSKLPQSGNNG